MPADLGVLIEDLAAETAALRQILDPLGDADWRSADSGTRLDDC